jgi:hypothetical protein
VISYWFLQKSNDVHDFSESGFIFASFDGTGASYLERVSDPV